MLNCCYIVVKIWNMQQPFGLHIHRNPSCVATISLWEDFKRHHTAVRQAKRRARSQAGWKQADRREDPSAVGSWNKSQSFTSWIKSIEACGSYIWCLDFSLVIPCHYLWSLAVKTLPLLRQASIDEARTQHHQARVQDQQAQMQEHQAVEERFQAWDLR